MGSRVEVRTGFDGSWASGYLVAAIDDDGIRLRRRSDGEELPATFAPEVVRREHRHAMWWV